MTNDKQINVMIVDDSKVYTEFLKQNLPLADKRINVCKVQNSAEGLQGVINRVKPHIITLDVEMPHVSGLEFLSEISDSNNYPVLLVSSLDISEEEAKLFGAKSFVQKPSYGSLKNQQQFLKDLAKAIVKFAPSERRAPSSPLTNFSSGFNNVPKRVIDNTIVAFGASTGGTETLLSILKELPANFPATVVTQHMPEGFTSIYAERLNRICKIEVREAKHNDVLKPGLCLISPGGECQTTVKKYGSEYRIDCRPAEKYSGHRPSVDVLFNSIADCAVGSKTIGVLLTGMGHDGAEGLLRLKRRGAFTIGQDKESSIVYGMPKVAKQLGAVTVQASNTKIPQILIDHIKKIK